MMDIVCIKCTGGVGMKENGEERLLLHNIQRVRIKSESYTVKTFHHLPKMP